ncbi:tripartite tricarboxylate transporter substrate binding protein [Pseudoroseomonas cervicalis]|uniref:Bug family tripartite tricarboxylate transporter substrate binding protein n=1 Tax=Teichococcus cervicalis TaxID=204525 RepID=UPI002781B0DC|nr:tripartite tricarboxylate transporter substrate-binding protein [Pseudoroseomonas cervicalis]MDQ1079103.1 tripartite-type tricarboxylate transporter receptor subunit TctC [Pseudoroseomonas cervicalis]
MIQRRILFATMAAGLATPGLVRAQSWPTRPLRMVVAYPPGGAVDLAGRLIADTLGARLGQPVVVENRTGGGGTIGTAAVAHAAPDGYTLGATAVNSLAINQYLYRDLPYAPEKDLLPVSLAWEASLVVVVPVDHVPARTIAEFVAWAKQRRGGIAFGSSGVGTTVHLSGEMLCRRTGIQGVHVPFRGGADALTSMLRGDTQLTVDNLPTALSNLRGGRLRPLAVTSAERSPDLPDVPTMAEAGIPDFVVTSWGTITVPAGTPEAVVNRLSDAMRQVAADPAVQERFRPTGNRPLGTTPQEAAARAARERPMWEQLVRLSGATLD